LDTNRQVLDISNNIFDCKILFVIETENETPFEFNVVDEETLKKNEFSLNRVENGYATGTARNIQQPTFLVITSPRSCTATVTLQHIKNPAGATTLSSSSSTRRTPAAAAFRLEPQLGSPAAAAAAANPKKFYQQTWFKALLAIVIILALYYLYKRMKAPPAATAAGPINGAAAPASGKKLKTSSLSIDPTSNDESSFGF
jgi:hypothetical protein